MNDDRADDMFCLSLLQEGAVPDWEELVQLLPGLPSGCVPFRGNPWINPALQSGSLEAVKWMILQGGDLKPVSSVYVVLQTALERNTPDQLVVLEDLLKAGADPNAHGIHDWTALHLAAVHEDFGAMNILLPAGARRDARSCIGDCATPEVEARSFDHPKAADFLRDWQSDPIKPRPGARR